RQTQSGYCFQNLLSQTQTGHPSLIQVTHSLQSLCLSLAEAKILQEVIAASEEGHAPVDHGMKLWMGLRRNRRQCYDASKPLRGFHWLTGDHDSSFSVWLKEPAVTCAVDRCVVITYHPASLKSHGTLVLKWQEGNCYIRTEFICKFSPLGLCPAPHYANQTKVMYRTPYGFSDRPLDLAPEGSMATTTCDASGRKISAGELRLQGRLSTSLARVQCFCHAGFVLEGNGVNCSDVDECEMMRPCLHRCNNLPGEFYCSCFDGYHLANDRSTLVMNGGSTNITSTSITLSSSTPMSFTQVFHQRTQSVSVRIKQGERSDLNVRQKRGADRVLLAVMAASVLIILIAIISCLVSYHQVEEQERKNKARRRELRLKNPSDVGTSVDGTDGVGTGPLCCTISAREKRGNC
uniref:EGF-like domain-containing protein n=1 Tax=Eptatretus burgeri TaxID=7764 RepID=A0A8C4NFR4_EPTBU